MKTKFNFGVKELSLTLSSSIILLVIWVIFLFKTGSEIFPWWYIFVLPWAAIGLIILVFVLILIIFCR